MSADIDALYKNARAVLWVEDAETRAWLEAVWWGLAPTIRVLVAGGQSNVLSVCEQATDAGWKHIFGLVDQDFGTSNRGRWRTLRGDERIYRLDVHELENLLLDSAALHGCVLNTGKRTVAELDKRFVAVAGKRTWWVACIRFLADTRRDATSGYPRDPGLQVIASLSDAQKYVERSDWFAKTASCCPAMADSAAVSGALEAAHAEATEQLGNGAWKTSFPGKQLFRDIVGYVCPNAGKGTRIDLVKAVGEWQRESGSIPAQASELHEAIVARV